MMAFHRSLVLVLSATFCSGCGVTPSEADARPASRAPEPPGTAATTATPEQAARATVTRMLELAEAGDWGTYVDEHYGEAHKFRGPADRDALVQRFAQRWGVQVLEALRRAVQATPAIEADGRMTFTVDGEAVFELHDHDGRWMFHL